MAKELNGRSIDEILRDRDQARHEEEGLERTVLPKDRKGLRDRIKKLDEQLLAKRLEKALAGQKVSRAEAIKAELRRAGMLSFAPGPGRDVRFKRLEQLRNYAQLENLEVWWKRSGKRLESPPPPGK